MLSCNSHKHISPSTRFVANTPKPTRGGTRCTYSGRKVELDEVIVPSLNLESSSSEKSVPVMPTRTREEANDDDHETSYQVTTKPRRSTRARSAREWYGNPIMEVTLLDHGERTNHEEAMMSPDSTDGLGP